LYRAAEVQRRGRGGEKVSYYLDFEIDPFMANMRSKKEKGFRKTWGGFRLSTLCEHRGGRSGQKPGTATSSRGGY